MQDRKFGYELVTLGHMIKRERDRANEVIKERILGRDNNVMCSDLSIIQFLMDNQDREIYQKDIEQYLSLTSPSVSNRLRELENKGLINRVYSKTDTRLKQVMVTESAKEIDRIMRDEIETFENRINRLLTDEEKECLSKVVDKLKKVFE